jgi:hypothetical protein
LRVGRRGSDQNCGEAKSWFLHRRAVCQLGRD